MTSGLSIRDASERDAEVCAVVYAPYVTDTVIASATARHAWLLLDVRRVPYPDAVTITGPKSRGQIQRTCQHAEASSLTGR
jgi:hypothetical protein